MYVVRAAVDVFPITRNTGTSSTESKLPDKLMREEGYDNAAASRGPDLWIRTKIRDTGEIYYGIRFC